MNVLMLTPDCYMIDRRIIQEAQTLVNAGYSVVLLAGFECEKEESYSLNNISIFRYKYDWDDERLKKLKNILVKPFLNKFFDKLLTKTYLGIARRLFRISPFDTFILSKAHQFKADIIHVHDLPCLEVGAILAKELDALLVYDSHEIYYEQDCLSSWTKKRLMATEAKYIQEVDLMITVNEAISQYFAKKYTITPPLVIMNCTELPQKKFSNFKNDLLNSICKNQNTKIVLYQGWISNERNIDNLVRSTIYFDKNTILVIVGYGDYEKNLKQIVDKEVLRDKVFFIGKIPSEEILNFTAIADVAVIPYLPIDLNHQLCSPNKFFEYVLAGVPIVSHDLPFFRSMSQLYGGILLGDLSSLEGMSACLNSLLLDDTLRLKLKTEVVNAGQYLNWDIESKKLINAYTSLVSTQDKIL